MLEDWEYLEHLIHNMQKLLAQAVQIPGYWTDTTDANGGSGPWNMFANFLFKPNQPNQSLGLLISRIMLFVIIASGLVFFVKLVMAGYAFMTSEGDSGKVQSATKEITNAVIGLVIVISSYFIIQIIEVIFGFKIL